MSLQLSSKTIAVLKNFSEINPAVLIHPGKEIRTMSVFKHTLGEYECEEDFPIEFAVADVKKFLSAIDMVANPILEFEEKSVLITNESGTISIRYYYADPSLIVSPTKRIEPSNIEATFEVKAESLKKIAEACSKLSLPDVVFEADGKNVKILAVNLNLASSHRVEVILDASDQTFSYQFLHERLRLIPGDYRISINRDVEKNKTFGRFENLQETLVYYIAPQA